MAVANAVGTWNVFASVRSCPAASGSNSGSSQDDQVESFENAEDRLLGLARRGGFKPVAFYRGQEPLGWADAMLHLHGFVILMLKNASGDETKFVRLDWGNGGLKYQCKADVNEFLTYATNEKAREYVVRIVEDAKDPGRTVVETLAWGPGIAVLARVAGHTAFCAARGGAAGSAVGPWGAVVGTGVGVAGAIGVIGGQIVKLNQRVPELEFLPTKEDATMTDVEEFLNSVKGSPYDLTVWNCNHFANDLVNTVL